MPTGYTTVSGSHLQDSTGTLIANATIYFKPVDNRGNSISFRAGGAEGQVSSHEVSAVVSNGVFSIVLADTTLTTPVNIGYSVRCIYNLSGASLLGLGYNCVQPSGDTWNFDLFVPNVLAQAPMTIVDGLAPKGVYDPTHTYGMGDVVRFGSSVYASMVPNNTQPLTDGENNAYWTLLVSDGATGATGPRGPAGPAGSGGGGGDSGPVNGITFIDSETGDHINLTFVNGVKTVTTGDTDIGTPVGAITLIDTVTGFTVSISYANGTEVIT